MTREAWSAHGSPNAKAWVNYFDNFINGSIGLDCTDIDVENFIENFGKAHLICQQCPTVLDSEAFIKHRIKVIER